MIELNFFFLWYAVVVERLLILANQTVSRDLPEVDGCNFCHPTLVCGSHGSILHICLMTGCLPVSHNIYRWDCWWVKIFFIANNNVPITLHQCGFKFVHLTSTSMLVSLSLGCFDALLQCHCDNLHRTRTSCPTWLSHQCRVSPTITVHRPDRPPG